MKFGNWWAVVVREWSVENKTISPAKAQRAIRRQNIEFVFLALFAPLREILFFYRWANAFSIWIPLCNVSSVAA